MKKPQSADDVVAYLRSHGQPLMALIVETLHANYLNARQANIDNVEALNRLRARYQPKPMHRTYRAPAESDG